MINGCDAMNWVRMVKRESDSLRHRPDSLSLCCLTFVYLFVCRSKENSLHFDKLIINKEKRGSAAQS